MRYLFFLIIPFLFSCTNAGNGKQDSGNSAVVETPEINPPSDFYDDCNLDGFENYADAIAAVRATSFHYSDKMPTPESSWIAGAEYYSCDGKTGFFILVLDEGREYIHANVPREVWENFKHAASKGEYYNGVLKGRYRLVIE